MRPMGRAIPDSRLAVIMTSAAVRFQQIVRSPSITRRFRRPTLFSPPEAFLPCHSVAQTNEPPEPNYQTPFSFAGLYNSIISPAEPRSSNSQFAGQRSVLRLLAQLLIWSLFLSTRV